MFLGATPGYIICLIRVIGFSGFQFLGFLAGWGGVVFVCGSNGGGGGGGEPDSLSARFFSFQKRL